MPFSLQLTFSRPFYRELVSPLLLEQSLRHWRRSESKFPARVPEQWS